MATGGTQPTNTGSTYKYNIIREDLEDFVYIISPTEAPVMQCVGRKGEFDNTFHEWPVVELAAANGNNAEVEGADAVNDAPTAATRHGNYAQLMDKVAQVSSTNERVTGAGNVQKMAKQVLYKTREIKRDMETRLCAASIANAGSDTVARQTAGIAAFLFTNVSRGAGGANGSLSGTTNGYPSVAETVGTARAFTEAQLKGVIQGAWQQGGDPSRIFVGGFNKTVASTFTGNATRYKHAEDKKLVASIDVYDSDFGELQIVPDRFCDQTRALVIDPERAEIGYLQPMRNEPLAKTGHSQRRMVSVEWGVVVGNEKAHGQVADLLTA